MKKLENYGILEIDAKEMVLIDGSGMISDFGHWLKCNCDLYGPSGNHFYSMK